jgi:Na+-driven multidrug efflux pump
MDIITILVIVNTVANAFSCAAIVIGAYYLGQRRENPTARYLSGMLYCIAAEIVFGTVALYFLDNLWVWIGLRLAGRAIEFVGVVRFLRYLSRATAVTAPRADGAGP